MRILFTGGREFANELLVVSTLRKLAAARNLVKQKTILINGGAPGLDTLVKKVAARLGIPCATVDANWDYYKRAAGPIRNGWMLLLQPDLLLSFPGGTGTADMTKRARAAGVEVVEVQE